MKLRRILLRALMPGGARARHQTLIFHRVLPQADPMMPGEPTAEVFEAIIARLADSFEIMPLHAAVRAARQGNLPAASLSITFDDGYADNALLALPILERYRCHATFFIASGFVDGGRMWNDTIIEVARQLPAGSVVDPSDGDEPVTISGFADRRQVAERVIRRCKYLPTTERDQQVARFAHEHAGAAALPDDLMMSTQLLQRLAASEYAEIGAHTCSHPILAQCDEVQAKQEIAGSIEDLQRLLGTRPRLFAYPNGKRGVDYLASQSTWLAEMGIEAAVATDWGVLDAHTDPMQIPRFTPWTHRPGRFVLDLLRGRYKLL